ncbi:MAG: corrinoid protein [candidate division Zixibacteria bacterium]|nr:corrinoid protein [candidate division Zixibacteria bacterium]
MGILEQISASLQKGNDTHVAELTRRAIEKKLPPKQILDDGLIGGMAVIGERFKAHEIFLPQVLLAARAMYAGMDLLKPLMIRENIPTSGKVVIGSVQGDLHDIGKNLVAIMLKGAGFEVIDLGSDVTPEQFVSAAEKEEAGAIGLSALLTTTMPVMKQVIDLLRERRLLSKIKVIIGGAPVTQKFADQIGADAYAFDGVSAVERVKALIGRE